MAPLSRWVAVDPSKGSKQGPSAFIRMVAQVPDTNRQLRVIQEAQATLGGVVQPENRLLPNVDEPDLTEPCGDSCFGNRLPRQVDDVVVLSGRQDVRVNGIMNQEDVCGVGRPLLQLPVDGALNQARELALFDYPLAVQKDQWVVGGC